MMKIQFGSISLACLFLLMFFSNENALALPEGSQQRIAKEMKKILQQSGLSESQVAVHAALGTRVMFSQSAAKKMIPASITKLVTAATALKHFPPGFKFKTTLASTAAVSGGTLRGDLYLIGGGDPSFVSETMWFLVNSFARNQIQKIEGDIVVDDSLFDQQRFDPSRQKERVDRAYDAPVGAMSFNWNSVNIFVRPASKAGEQAKVFLDPENDYVRLKNTVKTTAGKTSLSADRDEDEKGQGDLLKVTGSIALGSKEIVIYKNITQPALWAGHNLKSFLAQRGIVVQGKVRLGSKPSTAKVLAEAESKAIQEIVADMNKFSNNYVAEMLCKNISVYSKNAEVTANSSVSPSVDLGSDSVESSESVASVGEAASTSLSKSPGSILGGMRELRRHLQTLGIAESDIELINPSGLTRENKLTAEGIWRVLNDMKSQFLYEPEFMASLPIAGIDGTLKRRFKNGPGERWVRAKTGFLTGVISLAGYAGRKDGTEIPFVFIFNGSADEAKVRAVFDKLAVALVEME
jgi:D-alanyl-D-alanine carboxypeptidase/D-alanyl-D-alanine-endopeptidase (penicillin-binding protein 4)